MEISEASKKMPRRIFIIFLSNSLSCASIFFMLKLIIAATIVISTKEMENGKTKIIIYKDHSETLAHIVSILSINFTNPSLSSKDLRIKKTDLQYIEFTKLTCPLWCYILFSTYPPDNNADYPI